MVRSFLGDKCLVQTPVPLNTELYSNKGSFWTLFASPSSLGDYILLFTSDASISRSNIRKLGSVFIFNKLMLLRMLVVLMFASLMKTGPMSAFHILSGLAGRIGQSVNGMNQFCLTERTACDQILSVRVCLATFAKPTCSTRRLANPAF